MDVSRVSAALNVGMRRVGIAAGSTLGVGVSKVVVAKGVALPI